MILRQSSGLNKSRNQQPVLLFCYHDGDKDVNHLVIVTLNVPPGVACTPCWAKRKEFALLLCDLLQGQEFK
jgi:hypothetical protein